MKRILTILIFVLGITALGLVYYYFFFANHSTAPAQTSTVPGDNNFFPFGQGSATTTQTNTATSNPDQINGAGDYLQPLRLISNAPVAGATFIESKTGETIRYMERATAHIYDVSTGSSTITQLSNTTIPKIYEAFFTESGQSVVARSVESDEQTIDTWYAKIPTTVSTSTESLPSLSLISLPTNISFLVTSPSGKSIFYLQKSPAGSTGIVSSPNGSNKRQIWNSPIRALLPQFAGENSVWLTTAGNASVPSFTYAVTVTTATQKNILSNIPDLSVIANQTGTDLIYSTSNGGTTLFHLNVATNSSTQITPTTFGEKCAFDPKNTGIAYCAVPKTTLLQNDLDNWHLGITSYADDIWKYDLKAGTSQMIEDLSLNAGRDIDGEHLQVNQTGTILMFENKSDGSLWSLSLK